jgi:hypothetical protein
VRRYQKRIKYREILNEPKVHHKDLTVVEYAEKILRPSYRIIKAIDPQPAKRVRLSVPSVYSDRNADFQGISIGPIRHRLRRFPDFPENAAVSSSTSRSMSKGGEALGFFRRLVFAKPLRMVEEDKTAESCRLTASYRSDKMPPE